MQSDEIPENKLQRKRREIWENVEMQGGNAVLPREMQLGLLMNFGVLRPLYQKKKFRLMDVSPTKKKHKKWYCGSF